MRWTEEQLRDYEQRRNKTQNTRKVAVVERPACDAPLAKGEGEKGDSGKFLVRIESVRKRLLDPDNLSPKWLLDSLRFAKIIQGDEPEKITLEVTQRKCVKGEEEHTLITVTPK